PPEVTVPSVAPFDAAFASPSPSAAAPGAGAAGSAAGAPAGGAPAAAPAPGGSPSASPGADEEAKRAEREKRTRAEVAAAKEQADALTAQANAECPELGPGQQRYPGTVARCQSLKDRAGAAVQAYETAKRAAQAAGINVQ